MPGSVMLHGSSSLSSFSFATMLLDLARIQMIVRMNVSPSAFAEHLLIAAK
jgi:hypothetical protein